MSITVERELSKNKTEPVDDLRSILQSQYEPNCEYLGEERRDRVVEAAGRIVVEICTLEQLSDIYSQLPDDYRSLHEVDESIVGSNRDSYQTQVLPLLAQALEEVPDDPFIHAGLQKIASDSELRNGRTVDAYIAETIILSNEIERGELATAIICHRRQDEA